MADKGVILENPDEVNEIYKINSVIINAKTEKIEIEKTKIKNIEFGFKLETFNTNIDKLRNFVRVIRNLDSAS